ncbi:MAG: XisI protein [Cyanobacteriota bacterium]|nr:XisI protein [Cyanobacteriota bacterium]
MLYVSGSFTTQIETLYADFLGGDEEVQVELVFDRERDRYLLVEAGWQNGYRIYGNVLHLDIIDGKIWIQHDGTEDGVALELVGAGIPEKKIVLGFRSFGQREITGFAVS